MSRDMPGSQSQELSGIRMEERSRLVGKCGQRVDQA